MNKLNLLVHINGYEDENPTNNPSRNNFKWNRDMQGIDIGEPTSKSLMLNPGQAAMLFSGTVSTSDDMTTTWDLGPKLGASNTYRLSYNSGTGPDFRLLRAIGSDATTEVTVTKNAKVVTFTSTGGTLFDFSAANVQVGDIVRIGDTFDALNQGKFTVIAFDTTSFSVVNEVGQPQGPITLGADFGNQIKIHSQDGVQIGDKLDIAGGFSPVTEGTYDITDVSDDYIEFFSLDSLPTETGISNGDAELTIYRDAKAFIYIESDQRLDIELNGSEVTNQISPLSAGTAKKPGVFMSSSTIRSARIINTSQSVATIFYVTAE